VEVTPKGKKGEKNEKEGLGLQGEKKKQKTHKVRTRIINKKKERKKGESPAHGREQQGTAWKKKVQLSRKASKKITLGGKSEGSTLEKTRPVLRRHSFQKGSSGGGGGGK